MRKYLLLLFIIITTLVHAQELSIVGVPLSGTITEFSSKLQKKGYKISSFSKELPIGQRAFEGRFSNDDALILVTYFTDTKKVYDATLVISSFEESHLKQYYELFKEIISSKFQKLGKSSNGEIDRFNGRNMWRFFCYDSDSSKIASAYIYYNIIPADDEFDTIYQINLKIRNKDAPSFLEETINSF